MLVLGLSLTWFLFLLCLAMGLSAWMIFMWAVRSGQFKDAEKTAEEMLEWDNEEFERPDHELPTRRDEAVPVGAEDDESNEQ